jgi:hypothetical protein
MGGKSRSGFDFCKGVLLGNILHGEFWRAVQRIQLLLRSEPLRIRMIPISNNL